MRIRINYLIICFMACFMIVSCGMVDKKKYNILVIHSNQKGYVPYERYNKSFSKALGKEGLKANVSYFYLNCEKYNSKDEISRLDSVVNSHAKKNDVDLIVVNGDQATYSLLATHNPLLRKKPIVFGAVRYPNWDLLASYKPYNNVTGLYDSIDIVANMKFIKRILHCNKIITQIDDSFLDRKTAALIDSQLAKNPDVVNNIHWKYPLKKIKTAIADSLAICSISLRHSERMANDEEVMARRKDIEQESCGDMADRKVIGSQNYFFMMGKFSDDFRYLILKNETGSKAILNMYPFEIFTAIDENFEMNNRICVFGGYFTTWQTTAVDEAEIVRKILVDSVKAGNIAIKVPKKEYIVDWNSHNDRLNADFFNSLPEDIKIVNMPYSLRHPVVYYSFMYCSIVLVLILLVYFTIMYRKEQNAKIIAYGKLKEEQENMKLAVLGSKTYAWVIKEGQAHIADAFFRDMGIEKKQWNINGYQNLWFVEPEYRDEYLKSMKAQKNIGRHKFQFESDFGTGKKMWWEVRSTTIEVKGKKKIMGLMIDISDIKKYEQELDDARRKAIEGEKLAEEARKLSKEAELKQSFLANMSHEIRTPLNAIVGYSTLIADEGDTLTDEDKHMFIKDINKNTNMLLRLISDVLDISRIESGKMEFDFKKIPVNTVLDDVFNATRLQMPKHLQYIEHACESNPYIYVDEGRLQQVLSNFITNAGKFTKEGSVVLGCNYDKVKNEVEMYVEDTGIGLTPAEQKLVFDRFYKSDKYRQGTGLGLSISKAIVERLNGLIDVKSEKGKGSRFSVILKICV